MPFHGAIFEAPIFGLEIGESVEIIITPLMIESDLLFAPASVSVAVVLIPLETPAEVYVSMASVAIEISVGPLAVEGYLAQPLSAVGVSLVTPFLGAITQVQSVFNSVSTIITTATLDVESILNPSIFGSSLQLIVPAMEIEVALLNLRTIVHANISLSSLPVETAVLSSVAIVGADIALEPLGIASCLQRMGSTVGSTLIVDPLHILADLRRISTAANINVEVTFNPLEIVTEIRHVQPKKTTELDLATLVVVGEINPSTMQPSIDIKPKALSIAATMMEQEILLGSHVRLSPLELLARINKPLPLVSQTKTLPVLPMEAGLLLPSASVSIIERPHILATVVLTPPCQNVVGLTLSLPAQRISTEIQPALLESGRLVKLPLLDVVVGFPPARSSAGSLVAISPLSVVTETRIPKDLIGVTLALPTLPIGMGIEPSQTFVGIAMSPKLRMVSQLIPFNITISTHITANSLVMLSRISRNPILVGITLSASVLDTPVVLIPPRDRIGLKVVTKPQEVHVNLGSLEVHIGTAIRPRPLPVVLEAYNADITRGMRLDANNLTIGSVIVWGQVTAEIIFFTVEIIRLLNRREISSMKESYRKQTLPNRNKRTEEASRVLVSVQLKRIVGATLLERKRITTLVR